MSVLVAGKIAAAQQQIAALATFISELQHAAVALERHRPDGACDSDCGCVSDPAGGPDAAAAVSLIDKASVRPDQPPIACTLAAGSMPGRIADWRSLLTHVDRRAPIVDGVRCEFAATVPMAELVELVAAEQECCQFFRLQSRSTNAASGWKCAGPTKRVRSSTRCSGWRRGSRAREAEADTVRGSGCHASGSALIPRSVWHPDL